MMVLFDPLLLLKQLTILITQNTVLAILSTGNSKLQIAIYIILHVVSLIQPNAALTAEYNIADPLELPNPPKKLPIPYAHPNGVYPIKHSNIACILWLI
jgi:hypothetical protein